MKVDRLTILRCKAANAANLAACHREEATHWEREAREEEARLGLDESWSLSDPAGCSDNTKGLPADWLAIAELPVPDLQKRAG